MSQQIPSNKRSAAGSWWLYCMTGPTGTAEYPDKTASNCVYDHAAHDSNKGIGQEIRQKCQPYKVQVAAGIFQSLQYRYGIRFCLHILRRMHLPEAE